MSSAGEAILFVSLFSLLVLVAAYTVGYAAHCFHVVVQDTAAGNDEIAWPDEPFVDWFWKVFYLTWLAGIGVGLSWVLVRRVHLESDKWTLAVKVLATVGGGWLLFPIGLLSSLSASSPWVILRWTVLRQMIRHPVAVAVAYSASAVLLVGAVAVFLVALTGPLWWLIAVAGPVGAACLLIYGRLLGRLALVVLRDVPEEEATESTSDPPAAFYPRIPPAAPPPEPAPSPTLPVEGYEVQEVSRPSLLPLFAPLAANGDAHDSDAAPELPVARKRRRIRIEAPPLPRRPLLDGIYNFPWYGASLGPWLWLSFDLFVVGGMVRLVVLAKFWGGEPPGP